MRLELDVPAPVQAYADRLAGAGHDAVLVGGAVRDAYRGVSSADYDLVTDADTDAMRRLAADVPGVRSVYGLGERFGTVGIALDDRVLEVTRYRPDAATLCTLIDRFTADALHRDFTLNAIGYDLRRGTPLDPLGGVMDLSRSLLRAPGSPADRFAEDPLRIIRAGRFVAELPARLDPSTEAALSSAVRGLESVAVERIRTELTRLLLGVRASDGLRVLLECGALAAVLPEVAQLHGVSQPSFHDLDVFEHTLQAVDHAPPSPVLRWAALLHDIGKAPTRTVEEDGRIRFFGHAQVGARLAQSLCARLRFSAVETGAIVHLVGEHMRLGDVNPDNPRSVDRAVRKLDLVTGAGDGARLVVSAEDAVALTVADFAATAQREHAPAVRTRLEEAVASSRERGTKQVARSPISGQEIMQAYGLAEGPDIGAAKEAIERAIEAGVLGDSDREGAFRVASAVLGYEPTYRPMETKEPT